MAFRSLELARVAVEAEKLRWRRVAQAQGRRVVYYAVAAVFALFLLASVHVLIFVALRRFAHFEAFFAALTLCGLDLIGALVGYAFASAASNDRMAEEARLVREQAVMQLRNSLATAAFLRQMGRTVVPAMVERFVARRGKR